ncbi:MAG TPA: lasso peptide isopeptide bond-forming cyclase [Actinomycetes bacterium]|nr:lasso peptide isopeptide bond-forming cyclase [Actinomycetes bacterium]
MRFASFRAVPSWFVVLEDHDSARPVVDLLEAQASSVVSHSSGRPWLLGSWPDGTMTVGQAGTIRLALLGQHATTAGQLADVAARVREVGDVDRLAASLAGSSHLVASVDGQVRVQGTVTGVRRVFSANVGGAAVATDRADVLASLLNARPDEQRLALHLLQPHILYPLAGQPLWREVDVVPTDHYLVLDGAGRRQHIRFWVPPDPVVPMAEGASALREALSAAVALRTTEHKLVSCDLGGLDSTSICSLAAGGQAELVAYTAASPDPLADDVVWASRTVAGLGNVEHHVIPADEMPLPYQGILAMDDRLDEPFSAAVERERFLVTARRAAARGSRLHLVGFGGDELLYGSLAHLHSLLRSNPRIALGHLRGFAAKYRWPRGRMLRQLSDTTPYPVWLARVADTLTAPPPPMQEPLLDWGFAPRLPPWTTPAAVHGVGDLIRAEASTAEPLANGRGQHRELEGMRFLSRITGQLEQMTAQLGVTLAAPYYDDRVVEAGLAVRPQDRITPWRYKPLILEAMRGIVPDESLARQTKANGSGDSDPGLRRHRAELLALWEDSRLGRLGLIDAAALRELCAGPLPPGWEFGGLDQTVACELWLRSLERATVPS